MRKTSLIATLTLATAALAAGAAGQPAAISGFADASYTYATANANGEFGLDQVEIDVQHQASPRTQVRADLEWVKNGEDYDVQVEQAFMTYTPRGSWRFTLGRFNAPLGFELLDPVDMDQFSHSLVFDHGLPANLTGFSLGRGLGRGFELVAYGCNGWDRNAQNGANVTWGGRLGYAREGFGGGLSAISGKERDDADLAFVQTVLDVDLKYEHGRWTFGGEYNRGQVTPDGQAEQEWWGFLVMTHCALTDRAGLTVRYDRFDDQDGYAFGVVGDQFQQRQSVTVAPTFTLDDGFGALVELRVDLSDQDAFTDRDGEATDTLTTIAFEMTYSW